MPEGKLGRNTGNWQTVSQVGCEGAAGNADQIQHSWMLRTDTLSHQVVPGFQYPPAVTCYRVIGKRAEPITTYSIKVLCGRSM